MNSLRFLLDNLTWNFDKNYLSRLLAKPCTPSQILQKVDRCGTYDNNSAVNLNKLSFVFDQILLCRSKSNSERKLMQLACQYRSTFCRLVKVFSDENLRFESNGVTTKMEDLTDLLVFFSAGKFDGDFLQNFLRRAEKTWRLCNVEKKHFGDFVALSKCKYFCAVFQYVANGGKDSEYYLSTLFNTFDVLQGSLQCNGYYCTNAYSNPYLLCNVDSFANSSVCCDFDKKRCFLSAKVYKRGRNVFDTFTHHAFGKSSAYFLSENKFAKVRMQYFLKENVEVRRYAVDCNDAFAFELTFCAENAERYFQTDCHAVALCHGYSVCALLCNGKIISPCDVDFVENGSAVKFCATYKFGKNASTTFFDVVVGYCKDMSEVSLTSENVKRFNYTCFTETGDEVVEGRLFSKRTPSSDCSQSFDRQKISLPSKITNYCMRLGNDVSTLIDSGGKTTTVLGGLVCGASGDLIFAEKGKKIVRLEGNLAVKSSSFEFQTKVGSSTAKVFVQHAKGKIYKVTCDQPIKIIWHLPLEEKSKVSVVDKSFVIESPSRRFKVFVGGEVECFSTNAVECNENRLRTKLSGDVVSGDCLTLSFAKSTEIRFGLLNLTSSPQSNPLLHESLLSTYLNYVNEKNAFCFVNGLAKCDCLSLSAICYTNGDFVKRFLASSPFFYDQTGNKIRYRDQLAFALAYLYLAVLKGEVMNSDEQRFVKKIVLQTEYEGKAQCIRMLACKKMVQLSFCKVDALIRYEHDKKEVSANAEQSEYAQAVGAVDMPCPSVSKLKAFCEKHSVPKAWFYVSKLENLFGVSISRNTVAIKPTLQGELPEEMLITVDGKKMNTSFRRGSENKITVNGENYFHRISVEKLNENNDVVVQY